MHWALGCRRKNYLEFSGKSHAGTRRFILPLFEPNERKRYIRSNNVISTSEIFIKYGHDSPRVQWISCWKPARNLPSNKKICELGGIHWNFYGMNLIFWRNMSLGGATFRNARCIPRRSDNRSHSLIVFMENKQFIHFIARKIWARIY